MDTTLGLCVCLSIYWCAGPKGKARYTELRCARPSARAPYFHGQGGTYRRARVSHGHDGGNEEGLISYLTDQNHGPAFDESLQELASVHYRCHLVCFFFFVPEDGLGGPDTEREDRAFLRVRGAQACIYVHTTLSDER